MGRENSAAMPDIQLEPPRTSRKPSSRVPLIWWIAGVAGVLVIAVIAGWSLSGNQSVDGSAVTKVVEKKADPAPVDAAPISELRQPRETVECRLNTPEPGFFVFINEEPVRDHNGQLTLTPCEVALEPGQHVLRVAKKGWNDVPQEIEVTAATVFDLEPTYEPFAEKSNAISAPYLQAPIGQPVLLEPLKFAGQCQDPFVSANRLEIWYAAMGSEGTGIYYSTRGTAFDEWDAPSLLLLSRSSDFPASPSATADGLLVSYTVPGKIGRVWGLSRKSPADAFDIKKPLHYLEHGKGEWPSAQLSADGLRLYWQEMRGGKQAAWVASRSRLGSEFNEGTKLNLPGGHPCLSADELRQYQFDGKQLRRARRKTSTGIFSAPQVIAELALPGYVPDPARRQFWVTEDEQWLYYAEDPAASGNLYVVRLSNGPQRGVLVRGRSVSVEPAQMAKTADTNKTDPANDTEVEEKPAADLLSLPTPYAAFQLKLAPMLAQRDFAAAAQFVAEQGQNSELSGARQLLAWDAADVAQLQAFWQMVSVELEKLKPGDAIRVGGSSMIFQKYSDGVLSLNTKTKSVERKLSELSAGDLLAIADKSVPKTDEAGQLTLGIFLYYEGKAQAQASKTRLDRAGATGAEFREQHAMRRLTVIEQELARQNLAVALQLIDELALAYPQSPSTQTAERHRKEIYAFVKWNPQGSRKWEQGEDGSYVTTAEKKPGSLLVSANAFDRFDLSLEWRITSSNGRGGVYFRYPGQGKALDTAFKIQLANDAGVAADKFCTGALFNFAPPILNAAISGSQWNTLSMQVRGERVSVMINGKKVQDTVATDAAVPVRGFVALDGEYGGITYRKILLVESAPAPAASK